MLQKIVASQTPVRPNDEDIDEDLRITPTNQLTSERNPPIVNSHDNSKPGGPKTQNIDRNIISQQHSEQDAHRSEDKKKRGERGPILGRHLDRITRREGCKMKIDLLPGLS